MGTARHEVSGLRKAGDHPAGRAIASASTPDAGEARRHPRHLLSMVRSLSERRPGSSGRQIAQAGAGLESHPRQGARPDRATGPGRAGVVATETGDALYRYKKSLRGFSLSPAEGPPP